MKYPYEYPDDKRFAFSADDWLISYADQCLNTRSISVMTFSFAMVLELYLKAYYTNVTGDAIAATKFSHKIRSLLQKLKGIDADRFPASLNFKLHLLDYDIWELDRTQWRSEWFVKLGEADQNELRANSEFYLAMAYIGDLKYGISPSLEKHNGRVLSSSWGSHNKRLADIVVDIRNRIGYSAPEILDGLKYMGADQRISSHARNYLSDIYSRSR